MTMQSWAPHAERITDGPLSQAMGLYSIQESHQGSYFLYRQVPNIKLAWRLQTVWHIIILYMGWSLPYICCSHSLAHGQIFNPPFLLVGCITKRLLTVHFIH